MESINQEIKRVIITVRGQRVILDSDLAKLYGTVTKRLKEQIKRNKERFPSDFIFELAPDEKAEVVANCDHLKNLKYSSILPTAFTEHGAIMAANVLNSKIAIQASIVVVRAFVHAREILAEHHNLKQRLDTLERKVAGGFSEHEKELQALRYAIHQLMTSEEKAIGFGRK